MKQFRGIPFNVSVFRMETGQELFSVQWRTNDDKIMKFNLGEKSELCENESTPIVQKIMQSSSIVVECPKEPEGNFFNYLI